MPRDLSRFIAPALVESRCIECGAEVPDAFSSCDELFLSVLSPLYQRWAESEDVAALGRLIMDSFGMQHPRRSCKSAKSCAAHLTGLCCAVECNGGQSVYAAVQRWLNGPAEAIGITRPTEPKDRGRGEGTRPWMGQGGVGSVLVATRDRAGMDRRAMEFMRRAIELALLAEREGNLPVGAVITLRGEVVAEGRSRIWVPKFDATRHAEMEALRTVPQSLWRWAEEMTIYTTLEPCLMCFGSILLHSVGRVVFGSSDNYGGASSVLSRLPPFFRERFEVTQWLGPILPAECDPLHGRLLALEEGRGLQV